MNKARKMTLILLTISTILSFILIGKAFYKKIGNTEEHLALKIEKALLENPSAATDEDTNNDEIPLIKRSDITDLEDYLKKDWLLI